MPANSAAIDTSIGGSKAKDSVMASSPIPVAARMVGHGRPMKPRVASSAITSGASRSAARCPSSWSSTTDQAARRPRDDVFLAEPDFAELLPAGAFLAAGFLAEAAAFLVLVLALLLVVTGLYPEPLIQYTEAATAMLWQRSAP